MIKTTRIPLHIFYRHDNDFPFVIFYNDGVVREYMVDPPYSRDIIKPMSREAGKCITMSQLPESVQEEINKEAK